jgi:hypothetical protein
MARRSFSFETNNTQLFETLKTLLSALQSGYLDSADETASLSDDSSLLEGSLHEGVSRLQSEGSTELPAEVVEKAEKASEPVETGVEGAGFAQEGGAEVLPEKVEPVTKTTGWRGWGRRAKAKASAATGVAKEWGRRASVATHEVVHDVEEAARRRSEAAEARVGERAAIKAAKLKLEQESGVKKALEQLEPLYGDSLADDEMPVIECFYIHLMMFMFGKIHSLAPEFNDKCFIFAIAAFSESFAWVKFSKLNDSGLLALAGRPTTETFSLSAPLPLALQSRLMSQINMSTIAKPQQAAEGAPGLYYAFMALNNQFTQFERADVESEISPLLLQSMDLDVMTSGSDWLCGPLPKFSLGRPEAGPMVVRVLFDRFKAMSPQTLGEAFQHMPLGSHFGAYFFKALWEFHLNRVVMDHGGKPNHEYNLMIFSDPYIQTLVAWSDPETLAYYEREGQIEQRFRKACVESYQQNPDKTFSYLVRLGRNVTYVNDLLEPIVTTLLGEGKLDEAKQLLVRAEQTVFSQMHGSESCAKLFAQMFNHTQKAKGATDPQNLKAFFDLFLEVFGQSQNPLRAFLNILEHLDFRVMQHFCGEWFEGRLPSPELYQLLNDPDAWSVVEFKTHKKFAQVWSGMIRRMEVQSALVAFTRRENPLPPVVLQFLPVHERIPLVNALQTMYTVNLTPALLKDVFMPISDTALKEKATFAGFEAGFSDLTAAEIKLFYSALPEALANIYMCSLLKKAPAKSKYKLFLKIVKNASHISDALFEAAELAALKPELKQMCAESIGRHWRKFSSFRILFDTILQNRHGVGDVVDQKAIAMLFLTVASSVRDDEDDRMRLSAFFGAANAQFTSVFENKFTHLLRATEGAFIERLNKQIEKISGARGQFEEALSVYKVVYENYRKEDRQRLQDVESGELDVALPAIVDIDSFAGSVQVQVTDAVQNTLIERNLRSDVNSLGRRSIRLMAGIEKDERPLDRMQQLMLAVAQADDAARTGADTLRQAVSQLVRLLAAPLILRDLLKPQSIVQSKEARPDNPQTDTRQRRRSSLFDMFPKKQSLNHAKLAMHFEDKFVMQFLPYLQLDGAYDWSGLESYCRDLGFEFDVTLLGGLAELQSHLAKAFSPERAQASVTIDFCLSTITTCFGGIKKDVGDLCQFLFHVVRKEKDFEPEESLHFDASRPGVASSQQVSAEALQTAGLMPDSSGAPAPSDVNTETLGM